MTETWCNPSITNTLFNIPGYFIDPALRIYRSDTNCGRGGGIFILCKKWTYYFISCMTRQSADIFNLKPKNSKLELRRNCFRDRVETIGINYHKISNLLYSKTSMITTLDPQWLLGSIHKPLDDTILPSDDHQFLNKTPLHIPSWNTDNQYHVSKCYSQSINQSINQIRFIMASNTSELKSGITCQSINKCYSQSINQSTNLSFNPSRNQFELNF